MNSIYPPRTFFSCGSLNSFIPSLCYKQTRNFSFLNTTRAFATSQHQDYYKILGVSKNATDAEIKKAFKQQARTHHPDLNKGNKESEAIFKQVAEAYDVLSDSNKKRDYDSLGHKAYTEGGFQDGPGGWPGADEFDFSDIFGGDFSGFEGFEGFGDFTFEFGGRSGKKSKRSNKKRPGDPVKVSATLSFEQSIQGVQIQIPYSLKDKCDKCEGTGCADKKAPQPCSSCGGHGFKHSTKKQFIIQEECRPCDGTGKEQKKSCQSCKGSGTATKKQTIKVDVPAGVGNGETIRIPQAGNIGENGGLRGDLLISISVGKHQFFTRDKDDVLVNYKINVSQAILGGLVKVPTAYGFIETSIKPGTQSGSKSTIPGKGVKRGGKNGDLIITWNVIIPTGSSLTNEQYKILQDFAKEETPISNNYSV